MSSNVFPVSNNNNVLPIRQTNPNPVDLKSNFEALNLGFVSKLEGYISPTTAGTYAILDSNGSQISLPTNCIVNAIGLKSVGTTPSTGTSVAIASSFPQTILAAVLTAVIIPGTITAPAISAFAAANEPGKLNAVTVGTFSPDTIIKVVVYYLPLE